MQNRAFRRIALMLGLMFVAAVPAAQAGPVTYGDAVQVVHNLQIGQNQDLRLRTVTQQQSGQQSSTSTTGQTSSTSSSLLAGGATPQEGAAGQEVVIQEGDVEGTVCDCGEISIPGGWPKWPLLALIPPGICLTGICHNNECDTPPCQPVCTTCECTGTCGSVPEPASLLLLGTGLAALGAGARRRFSRSKETDVAVVTTEG